MKIYEVVMLNPEYDGEDHFVIAKSKQRAKNIVLDYYEQGNDGYCSPVTERDLAVNGPIEPENYAEDAKKQVNKPDYSDVQFQKYQDDLKLARRMIIDMYVIVGGVVDYDAKDCIYKELSGHGME